jgi:tripartite-type tricarboxylate transporter receptor subunit TctC
MIPEEACPRPDRGWEAAFGKDHLHHNLDAAMEHTQALGNAAPEIWSSFSSRGGEFPDVPTFKEQGIGFVDETSWYGFFAPRGTTKEVVAKVNRDVNRILDDPEMKQRTAKMGFRLFGGPPEKLEDMLRSEIAKWAEIAKRAGMTAR